MSGYEAGEAYDSACGEADALREEVQRLQRIESAAKAVVDSAFPSDLDDDAVPSNLIGALRTALGDGEGK